MPLPMTLTPHELDAGLRLDKFLSRRLPDCSRARLQAWIRGGQVRVDGAAARPSLRLRGGERVEVEAEAGGGGTALPRAFAEDIPLEILYQDGELAAINKPAGLVVHAGAGRTAGTAVNALLHRFQQLSGMGGESRPGIVHRLDRLTSGVLLAAMTDEAHLALARQFARREVAKSYLALVHARARPSCGQPLLVDGIGWMRLENPIRRDRRRRTRMTARAREGREAVTDFRVLEQWPGFCLLEVRIHTGRTHQIRVHLSTAGHPVVGDTLYGAPGQPGLRRHFLHAARIAFRHPSRGEAMVIQAPLPGELENHLDELRANTSRLVLL